MIFDTLLAHDADLKLRPQMVDKWTVSRDGMKYSFTLRDGPGGPCSGLTRVRYTIRNGKFTAWRQLEEPDGPEV